MHCHLIIVILLQLSANKIPGQVFLYKLDNLRMSAEIGDDMVDQKNQFVNFIINSLPLGFKECVVDDRGAFLYDEMIDQLHLVMKVKVERTLGNSRFLGDLINGNLMHLIAGKQCKCGFFNPFLFLTLVQ